jgi:hypothetical protein
MFSHIVENNCEDFLSNEWVLIAFGISTIIPSTIGTKFFRSKVIVLDDSATRATFLYNELG